MMGRQTGDQSRFFYLFNLEQRIPRGHLLRRIALPTVAWGILAFEFDRPHSKKKLFESAIIYAVLIISLILFCIAGWRLPQAFITDLYITE
jgi:hypothetical protein